MGNNVKKLIISLVVIITAIGGDVILIDNTTDNTPFIFIVHSKNCPNVSEKVEIFDF